MVNALRFEFLDVGQGDGTLVEFSPVDSGELWLVDFGKKSSSTTPIDDAVTFLVQRISDVCRARGIALEIDRLVITHVDGDHWNRLGNLINGETEEETGLWEAQGWPAGTRLAIGDVTIGGDWRTYHARNPVLAALIDEVAANRTEFPHNFGDATTPQWQVGATDVYVLSANRGNRGDANPDSVVLLFEFAGTKVILTGDAESRIVEPAILALCAANLGFLKSYLLKLGHHGSKASTSPDWLYAVKPDAVIASGDKRWGHPYAEPFDRARDYLDDNDANHRLCMSGGAEGDDTPGDADDYQNFNTQRGAYTNLWFVVKENNLKLSGPDDDGMMIDQEFDEGTYFGVQWSFEIADDGSVDSCVTAQWPSPDDDNVWGGDSAFAALAVRKGAWRGR